MICYLKIAIHVTPTLFNAEPQITNGMCFSTMKDDSIEGIFIH